MSGKAISVIIVSYRSGDVIDGCLRSIREQNDLGDELEVILVEQSPEEDLYRYLTAEYPEVTVIRAENRGFGAGNNLGAAQAQGEILFFLNPDTVVESPVFAFIRDQFAQDPRMGLAGVRLLSPEGEQISWNMRFPYGLANKLKYVLYRRMDRFDSRQMYIEGADLIIRGEAFRKAGGFDEKIFMYGEELDICERIRRAGYTIRYFPERTIRHLQGKCTDDRYPAVYGKQLDAFLYDSAKHGFDARKWLRREYRYQTFLAPAMKLAGNKSRAELAKELKGIVKEKLGKI